MNRFKCTTFLFPVRILKKGLFAILYKLHNVTNTENFKPKGCQIPFQVFPCGQMAVPWQEALSALTLHCSTLKNILKKLVYLTAVNYICYEMYILCLSF